MKWLFILLAAALGPLAIAQTNWGTIVFYNRNLSAPNASGEVNVPFNGFGEFAQAQLLLVSGSGASTVYTPLYPLHSFRPAPNQEFLNGPVVVEVTGHGPGTTGLHFVVRVWDMASTYETAHFKGQSELVTVAAPLGGSDPSSGTIFPTPDLGGPNGIRQFTMLGSYLSWRSISANETNVNLEIYANHHYVLQTSTNLTDWTPALTNIAGRISFPFSAFGENAAFRLRSPWFSPN